MAKQKADGISWTDETWNPVYGCNLLTEGCKNCYAMGVAHRFSGPGQVYEGLATMTSQGPKWTGKLKLVESSLDKPLRWRRQRRIFVNSMSDLFHENVPREFIDKVFAVMALSSNHIFQVLTKRPERMLAYLSDPDTGARIGKAEEQFAKLAPHYQPRNGAVNVHLGIRRHLPLPNVWLGVSVESQKTADARIPLLLQTPAAVHWLSMEPLLGHVDLERILCPNKGNHRVDVLRGGYWNKAPYLMGAPSADLGKPKGGFTTHSDMTATIDWVVVGGESGPKARPMHPAWVRSLRDQCLEANVPFHFKQWGEWVPRSSCYHTFEDGQSCSDMDPGAERWPSIRLTEKGSNGHNLVNADNGEDAYMQRVGKKMAGRRLFGALHDAYPDQQPAGTMPCPGCNGKGGGFGDTDMWNHCEQCNATGKLPLNPGVVA